MAMIQAQQERTFDPDRPQKYGLPGRVSHTLESAGFCGTGAIASSSDKPAPPPSSGNTSDDFHNRDGSEALLEPVFIGVPSRPNHFVSRDSFLNQTVSRILFSQDAALALEGSSGIGKTTLAGVVASHPAILSRFSGGVLWATLGRKPDVLSSLKRWARALGLDLSSLVDEASLTAGIRQAVADRSLLFVCDDVWDLRDIAPLQVGGSDSFSLITTHEHQVAREFAQSDSVLTIPPLTDKEAFELLCFQAPEACALDPVATRDLASTAGGLPLAIMLLANYLTIPENSYFSDLCFEAIAKLEDPVNRLQLIYRLPQ